MKAYRLALAALAAPLLVVPAALAHDEIVIGHNAAGRLALQVHVPMPFVLEPSIFAEFPGWTGVEPAVISNPTDDPDGDFFVLPGTVNIKFFIEGFDPEMRLLSDEGSHWMMPGETYQLGSPFFHVHPIWNLVPQTTAGAYEMRVHLIDTTGQYADSGTYIFTFIRQCPADLTLDGVIDFSDYLEFLNFFDIGDTTVDYNNDGIVDFADYLEFLNFFDGGC